MTSDKAMVQFDNVSKLYSRGAGRSGSLRDAIPALAARALRRRPAAKEMAGGAREFWALRDVSFEVRRGEALGIIGHNGAGKSTALKLLAGVTAATGGRVRVDGRFAALIELGAGFHPDLTGRENVYLNGSIIGLRKAEIDRQLDSIVDFAGIEKFIDTPVKRYSSGMQARLGFAVAAHVEPDVLLIDEVLSVGDWAFQQKCMKKMEEYRRDGTAIVFVSHNMNAIASLCSKAILLRAGEVMASGSPKEVIDHYTKVAYTVVSDEEAAQATDLEHGRITHHMKIVGADIYDGDGRPVRSFLPGQSATVVLRLCAQRDVEDPIIGIGLRNSEATWVYGTNTGLQKIPTGKILAGEELRVAITLTLNLCVGAYSLSASAAPAEGQIMMDWRENLVAFDVLGQQTANGIADLKASISLQGVMSKDRENEPSSLELVPMP